MKLNKKLGFTLIELLVVITIIAILATVGINQFGKSLQKARDSKRTSDILSIQSAVTQAFTDEQEYPSTVATDFSGAVLPYIDKLPKDEKFLQPGNKTGYPSGHEPDLGYVYKSGADESGIELSAYEISTAFEADTNVKNSAKKDNGDDDNRKEIGTLSSGYDTSLKKDATCTADNTDASLAIILGGEYTCAATHYNQN